ncbi:MAG: Beta-barrel assembly-enhancing protease [Gammaproteobacteria bacterium]|nr:Beta-barrel assembly-enhancing protease [Gammaproteobacteria bacterium]
MAALLAILMLSGCAAQRAAVPAVAGGPAPSAAEKTPIPTFGEDLRVSPDGMSADALYTLLVAELAGQRGEIDIALDNYMRLMRAIPDPQIAERAARVAAYAQREPETMEAVGRWVQLQPKNLEARQLLAGELLRTGRRDEALVQLDYILNSAAGEPAERMWAVANLLSREQDKKAAVEVMEKLIDQHGRTPEALFAYALLAIRAEQMDKAREAMDQVAELKPTNEGVAIAYIGVLQKQGETKAAIEWLESVLKNHPEQQNMRLIYARLLADDKQYDSAYKEFKALEKQQPANADVKYALGLLELQRQNSRKARPYFEELVKMGEHADEGRFYLGQIAESENDDALARKWFEEVKEGELLLDSRLRVALMLARQGKPEEAQKYLQGITPESEAERIRLIRAEGEILADAGELQAAMDVYDRALNDTYDSELLYTRAMLAEKMNRLDILERDLRQLLERDPDNSQALNALGYTLADRTTRYDEAYTLIKRALELAPNDFYILDSMGWVLFKQGKLDEALNYLGQARAQRDDPEVVAHMVEVLVAKGERNRARQLLAEALKSHPEDERLKKVKVKFGL